MIYSKTGFNNQICPIVTVSNQPSQNFQKCTGHTYKVHIAIFRTYNGQTLLCTVSLNALFEVQKLILNNNSYTFKKCRF